MKTVIEVVTQDREVFKHTIERSLKETMEEMKKIFYEKTPETMIVFNDPYALIRISDIVRCLVYKEEEE